MKRKLPVWLCMLFVALLSHSSFAQYDELKERLQGKQTFREITETYEQFIQSVPAGNARERLEKHFNRWAYYQSLHLGPSGEFVNISKKTLEAVQSQSDAPLTSANGSWAFIGPDTTSNNNPNASGMGLGRVDRIAFHPSNANTIYVGTPAGGLWKTTNGGVTWSALSNFIPSLGISGIVIDWNNTSNIYVLTGDGDSFFGGFVSQSGYIRMSVGVLVSHDGGVTWEQTGVLSENNFCGYQLIQHPTNPAILIAATSDGIFRTTNSGQTWVRERAGTYYDVEFKPGTPATVYASGPGAFFYSNDTGDTWFNNSTFDVALCAGGRVEIGVTPNSPNRVFLLAGPGNVGANTFCGFYQSTNSGQPVVIGTSFTRLSTTPNVFNDPTGASTLDQSAYDIGIAVRPNNFQTIVLAGLITHLSTNGGSVFTALTSYWESGGNYIHPDVHCVAYNPLNNNLYAATDGGFYRSTNDGTTWTNLSSGINVSQFFHLDDFDANSNVILTGAQDNGIKYRSGNSTYFSHINSGDGFGAAIQFNNQSAGFAGVNARVRYFTNYTTTGSTVIYNGTFFMPIALHASIPTMVYIGSSRVFSYDAAVGGSATQLGNLALGNWAIKTCPSNASRIYAAGGASSFAAAGQLFMTSNGGSTWDTISDQPGFPAVYPRITDIGVKPNNSAFVYATFSGYTDGVKVVYSSSGGQDWYNISYDLPNIPVWSIEVDANNNIYIGTDLGVYYKAAGATSWEPFYNGLPNVPVSDLAINEGSDQLLASTFGRGIWKSSLRTSCPLSVTINSNVSGQYFRSASSSITMSGKVTGGLGSDVVLRSNGYIDLTPGFQANADPGSSFIGIIGPCDAGLPPSNDRPAGDTLSWEGAEFSLDRHAGTLEVQGDGITRQIIVRQFEEGPFRILLASESGTLIREVGRYPGVAGTTNHPVSMADLAPGLYYLYLVVNGRVTHLQEVEKRFGT